MSEETIIKLKKFQYSSSKRACGKQCWLQYYHRYVAKTYDYNETPATAIGNLCDTVIENAIARGEDPNLDKLADDILELDPRYRYLEPLVEGVDAAYEYAITRTGLRIMQASLALNKQLKPTLVDWRQNSPLFDAAKPDLITCLGDETTILVDDWKSGNPDYPSWDQLEDYALYMFILFPHCQQVVASFVWLRRGRHPEDIVCKSQHVYHRKDLKKTVERWAEMHRVCMENNDAKVWPATFDERPCSWCDHNDFCPEVEQYR